jgi:hypothetical protein
MMLQESAAGQAVLLTITLVAGMAAVVSVALAQSQPTDKGPPGAKPVAAQSEAKSERPTFPIKASRNGHYFVDARERPFLYHADTPWGIFWKLSREEALQYLQNRKAKGFTTLQTHMLPFPKSDAPNKYGQLCFSPANDMARPNAAYFDHVEWVIRQAEQLGLLVAIAPYWIDGDWSKHLNKSNARVYGRYLGQRFKDCKNVVWINGGDRDPDREMPIEMIRMVAEELHKAAPHQLQTYHGGCQSSSTWFHNDAWLGFNMTYTYGETFVQTLHDYNLQPVKPNILGESGYENESNDGRDGGPHRVRRQAYWTMLAGSAGAAYGNRPMWFLGDGWVKALDSVGARHAAIFGRFMRERPWYRLVSDPQHVLLTDGGRAGGDSAMAALADDGSFALIYMPTAREITVDLGKLKGPVAARWFDPTQETYQEAVGSPVPGSRRAKFTPPPKNASGDSDFVLVLEAGL